MTRRDRRPEALVLDEGVLAPGGVCEFGSALGVEAQGGTVVTPWRDQFLAAEALGLAVVETPASIATASHAQAIVHLQKSRAATFADLAEAWRVLRPGGRLLLAGTNSLGVVSAVKRLAAQIGQRGVVVSNRARARVVRFERDDGPGPHFDEPSPFTASIEGLDGESQCLQIATRPGVFSASKLDPGSRLLLEALPSIGLRKPPRRLVDLGCGTGVLGLAAATRWPELKCLLVDADARAVACARENAERHGLAPRARVTWWDAREAPSERGFDLALLNPPFHHRGPEVDLAPALALFDSLAGWLDRHGRALVVANHTLPYETLLSQQGDVERIASGNGYKLLSVRRHARSAAARGRKSPGARSGGRSSPPTRSR